jgi:Family of unknown function (DUF5686)/Carboxypeptidase regulatory-like domain
VPLRRIFAVAAAGLAVGLGAAAAQDTARATPHAIVVGTVYDTVSGRPLRLVVVRTPVTGETVLTDDDGHFTLVLPPGEFRLELRRIGYEPASVTVHAGAGVTGEALYLHPVALGLAPVVVTGADDLGRRIMRRVIARKHRLYAAIHDYRYDASVKLVLRDADLPSNLPASVLLITETRTSAYWERPDHYQETILARRQSRNFPADQNLVSVGEILNFSKDRVDIPKYSVVSPIADDALEHYDYRVLDTLTVDGRRAYRIGIAPRSRTSPLFVGMLDVADSTYDVLDIDVGLNEAVRYNFLDNVRYRQRLRDVGGGRWMPVEIRLTGELHLGLPLPGLPERIAFEHVASLDRFRFDEGERPPKLGEFRVVVHPGADREDSAAWAAPGVVSLTAAERAAWVRIDSLASAPPDLGTRVLGGFWSAVHLSTDDDFFHFNRVDGAALGAGRVWRRLPGLVVHTRLGYATGADRWQYRFGARVRLSEAQRVWVGVSHYDETHHRPTLVSRDYNPTVRALLFGIDPHDYYRARGWTATFSTKLVDFTRLDLRYTDVRQSSVGLVTGYAVFDGDEAPRPNPPIADGRLRALSATLAYDSRPLLEQNGRAYYLGTLTHTRISLDAEIAAPRLIPSDFAFRRYTLELERRQRTLNLGVTSLHAVASLATGRVPPQCYGVIDFGMRALTFQGGGVNTLGATNFAGTRALLIGVEHDFDRWLFAKTRLPLVRDLPFTLSVHGAVFWTDFKDHAHVPGESLVATAPTPYSEVGFGIGNLTPFLSPLNLAAHFTWQLSAYATERFEIGLWLTPP